MALAERFAAPPPIKRGPQCSVGKLLVALPKPEAKALAAVLLRDEWAGTQIAEQLQEEGHGKIGGGTIQRHRTGRCGCEVSA